MNEQADSLYLSGELYERIALAQAAYRAADEHRYDGEHNHLFGYEGSNFCGMLSEYLSEITDEAFDEISRFDTSTSLYETAWEYYPSLAPLLDGDEIELD